MLSLYHFDPLKKKKKTFTIFLQTFTFFAPWQIIHVWVLDPCRRDQNDQNVAHCIHPN